MPSKNVWLTVNGLTTSGKIGEIPTTNGWSQAAGSDFADFIDPSQVGQWANVAAATSTIKLYAYDAFHLTSAQLQAVAQFARQNGYKIVLEAGVLQPGTWNADGTFREQNTPPAPGNTGTGWGVEGFNGAMQWAYLRLKAAGVTLDYVAMDEGCVGALQEGWTLQQVAAGTAAGLRLAQSYFPNIQFGDIENLHAMSTATLAAWISAYKQATGQNLAFFQADSVWGAPNNWTASLEQASALLAQLGIPLGILISPYGVSSSIQWTDTALNNMINIFLDSKIFFSSLNFQSWDSFYPKNIMSATTSGTLTNAAQEFLYIDPVNILFNTNFGRTASYLELFYYSKLLANDIIKFDKLSSIVSNSGTVDLKLSVRMQDTSLTSASGISFTLVSSLNKSNITIVDPGNFSVPQYVNETSQILIKETSYQANKFAIVGTISCKPVIEVTTGGVFWLNSSTNYAEIKINIPRILDGIDSGIHLNGNANITVNINNSGINNIWIGASGQTVNDMLGYSCTYVDAPLMTAATTINGGGQGQLNIYKGGAVQFGGNVSGVNKIVLYHDSTNEPAYNVTTSAYQKGTVVYASGGNDTISLADASQTVIAARTGTLLVRETAANAGVSIVGNGPSSTTLEIISGGTATVGAGTSGLTVKLDQACVLNTNSAKFLLIDASVGGCTVNAYGTGQVVHAGRGGIVTDASKKGITLIGTSAELQGNIFKGFNARDLIDITDFDLAHSYLSSTSQNGLSHVVVHNLGAQFDFYVTPAVPSIFRLASDGHGGLAVRI